MTLTWYDFVVIGVLIYTTLRGAQRGLVSQLAWIVALVLCFGFAEGLSLQLAPRIREVAPSVTPPLDRWIAMLVLYLGFSFASFGAARVLKGWIEKAKFEDYDRHLGGVFGFVRGIVLSLVATFFIITLSESGRETVLASKSGYGAAVVMNTLEPVMPKELASILEPYINRLDPDHDNGELNEGDTLDPFERGKDLLFGNGDPQGATGNESETKPGNDLWDLLRGGDGNPDPASQPADGNPGETVSLRDFIRSLPESMSRELKDAAVNKFRNATPEQQNEFLKQVRSALPENVGGIVDRFNRFREDWNRTAEPDPPTNGEPPKVADRDKILDIIAGLRSSRPEVQSNFRTQVNQRLTGVPAQVATAVLVDWQADLTLSGPDPDPGTSAQTRFDQRLYRQLTKARVPIERLSQSLQDRMRNVARQ